MIADEVKRCRSMEQRRPERHHRTSRMPVQGRVTLVVGDDSVDGDDSRSSVAQSCIAWIR